MTDTHSLWTAARRAAAIADLSVRRARLVVTGRDRRRFLQGLTSNDVQSMSTGMRRAATLLNAQGKLLAAFHVHDRGDDFLIECAGAAGARLREALDRYVIADDVQIALVGPEALPAWAALGPGAAAIVREAVGEEAPPAPPDDERFLVARGGRALLASARAVLGAPGFVVMGVPAPAEAHAPQLDDETLEVLRIEGGVPAPGREIDEKLLPQEAALDGSLSFTKGCYVGQEAVAMLHYRGKLRRKLLGLVLAAAEGETPARDVTGPAPGARVVRGEEEVGWVTSGPVRSPAAGALVALAVMKLPAHEPGTEVEVRLATGALRAVVHGLPFVREGE